MKPAAATVKGYLESLPPDRRKSLETVRRVILANLPKGFVEDTSFGMIGYVVPLSVFPDTYNGQPLMYAALANQKNYMAVHVLCAYGSTKILDALKAGFRKAGKKLDMGKSCIRFKSADDLALDAIGEAIAAMNVKGYIAIHEAAHSPAAVAKRRAARATSRRAAAKARPEGKRARATK